MPRHEDDNQRLDGRTQTLDHDIRRGFQVLADVLEHRLQLAALFADGHHVSNRRIDDAAVPQRGGDVGPGQDAVPRLLNGALHEPVARRLGDDAQRFGDGEARADQRRKRRGEPGHDPLLDQRSEHRQRKQKAVPQKGPAVGPEETPKAHHDQDQPREEDQHPPARQHAAEIHHLLRDPRQLLSGPLDLLADRRNHLRRQNQDGQQAEDHQDYRVDHHGQDLRLHPLAFLHEVGDGLEALAQRAGDLADPHHRHVDDVEVLVVVLQGVGERFARDDAVANLGQGGLEALVRRLQGQDRQRLRQLDAGIQQRRQLLGEVRELRLAHPPPRERGALLLDLRGDLGHGRGMHVPHPQLLARRKSSRR